MEFNSAILAPFREIMMLNLKITFRFIWAKSLNQQPTLDELENAIVDACNNLQAAMVTQAFQGMVSRAQRCLNVNENAFPNE